MTATKRKSRRSRSSPPLSEPSEAQLFEAMLAFATLKMRYRLEQNRLAPVGQQYVVRVIPENVLTAEEPIPQEKLAIHRFVSEQTARRWREHEIIRETIKVAMRTRP